MHRYEVGKPFAPGATRPEGAEFNWRSPECDLVITMRGPSPDEVESARVGPAEFALYHEGDQILLCYRFRPAAGRRGGIPWSDAPYHIGRLAAAGRPAEESVPPPDPATLPAAGRQLLHVVLVDADGGIVRVLRAVTLSPEFTRALYAAIRDQASRPYDRASYEAGLDRIYARYPSDRLAAACRVHCEGGA